MEHTYGGTTIVGTTIPLMIPGIGAIRKTPKMRWVFLLRKTHRNNGHHYGNVIVPDYVTGCDRYCGQQIKDTLFFDLQFGLQKYILFHKEVTDNNRRQFQNVTNFSQHNAFSPSTAFYLQDSYPIM
jgi:hypothetical protein